MVGRPHQEHRVARRAVPVPERDPVPRQPVLHLERVAVMDNGAYSEGATNPSTEINIRVVDTTTSQQGALTYIPSEACAPLRVVLEYSHPPLGARLRALRAAGNGSP